nr:glycoside hydrolase family 99-like domain-containing protein [uncultured Agathobacter sp.]
MKKTKMIAMYLPQYHETEDNNKWWGKGFTDWTSVKGAEPLYKEHNQPRIPMNNNYYDLTDVQTLKWQASTAKKYGIYGFGIYHYWFSTDKQTLTKPAELILENKDIDIPFFLSWDNNSWVRTWSKYKHNTNAWSPKVDENLSEEDCKDGILAKLDYGNEEDWKIHFEYLKKFFDDSRYIKIDGKPVFVIWNYTEKDKLKKMCEYWRKLALEVGYNGLYLINRYNPYDSMEGFDTLFTYEPMFSAWQNKNLINRICSKIKENVVKEKKLTIYDYDDVWNSIIKNARLKSKKNIWFGGFVGYDDTPRRGKQGKIVKGESPKKFEKYLKQLKKISETQDKDFIFLTAWNEWGEGAYLEPDQDNKYEYLEALKRVVDDNEYN